MLQMFGAQKKQDFQEYSQTLPQKKDQSKIKSQGKYRGYPIFDTE